jgi:hypothetical protein
MKKLFSLLIIASLALSTQAGMISVPVTTETKGAAKVTMTDAFSKMDAQTFLSLTPAKVKEITGKKMTLGQKVSLKMAQAEVKKQLKKGKEVNLAEMGKKAGSGISALWLILGLLLGLIGVLIALLTKKDKDDNRVKSSLIGWGIWVAIVIIAFVI